jgi:hypothetical protein
MCQSSVKIESEISDKQMTLQWNFLCLTDNSSNQLKWRQLLHLTNLSYASGAGRTTWLNQSAGENVIQDVLQVYAGMSVETEFNKYFTVQL